MMSSSSAKLAVACLLAGACAAAAMSPAPKSMYGSTVEDVASKNGDLTMLLMAAGGVPEVQAITTDPKAECTVFAPTNDAYQRSLEALGPKVGLAMQNETLQATMLAFHVIPKAFNSSQLGRMDTVKTLKGEVLSLYSKNGQLYAYSNYKFPVAVQVSDIKAGNCWVHTINRTIIAPSLAPTMESWIRAAGNWPEEPPRSLWAPARTAAIDGAGAGPASSSSSGAAAKAAAAPAVVAAKSGAAARGGSSLAAVAGAAAALAVAVVVL